MSPRLFPVIAFALLFGASVPALATAAKPESVSVRKEARARFVTHLNSDKHQSTLDGIGKQQLLMDLKAQFVSGHAALVKLAPDAALLVEMKRLHNGAPEVELTSRYGAKLLLARTFPSGFSARLPVRPTELSVQMIDVNGKRLDANSHDLISFGITKPKHFKALLKQAMERLAPEDYTK